MKNILLTYMESGNGHITSIKAISDALKKMNDGSLNLIDSYVMQEGNDPTMKWFNNFIIKQTKNTNSIRGFGAFVFGFLEFMGGPPFMVWVHHVIFRKALLHTLKAIDKFKPDVIVSTHYFMTLCGVEYKKRYNQNCELVTYNPDNNTHPWWDRRDGYFVVNNINAYNEAIKRRKFKKDKVSEVYFTARNEIINAKVDKAFYREKYGIDKNKLCVIIADGAYASAKSSKVCEALLKTDLPITIIMLAGKNQQVFDKFKALENTTKPNITLITQGFTTDIHELYCASDLFITKAGPNAMLDSVFMETPILVDYYAHPIEKASAKLFVDTLKCGTAIYNIKKLKKQVEEYIKNPHLLDEYRENCKKLDKTKNGAIDVAKLIIKEANVTKGETR